MNPNARYALAATLFLALGLGVYWLSSGPGEGIGINPTGDKKHLSREPSPRSTSATSPGPVSSESPGSVTPGSATVAQNLAPGKKNTVDPTSTWSETPAWPEGPKLYAEVETASTRYINLRPNDMGLMPQIRVEPGEALHVTLRLPEAEVGDKVYLEIPNGGKFPGESAVGKVLPVAKDQSVSFDYTADRSRGNCTIHIRQKGRTRTLPLWVGEPVEHARDE